MPPTSPGSARALVASLVPWIDRLFPEPARAGALTALLTVRFGEDERTVDADVCREIATEAHAVSRHFALTFVTDGSLSPDAAPPGALLPGARAVVLDLRDDGGGDPGTLTLMLDRLLDGTPLHVSTVHYRDRVRQWWTPGRPERRASPAGTPVAVLVGGRTFSSGEALADHLQVRGRAVLVGEPTPGAADHVTPAVVAPHVRADMPEGVVRDAVAGGNREGSGVVPDVACAEDEAAEAALALLRAT